MHKRKHIIGVHTGHDVESGDHILHTTRQEAGELGNDINRAEGFIEKVLAEELKGNSYMPRLIRPVEGEVNPDVVRTYYEKYYKSTMWDVDSEDSWPGATPKRVIEALVTQTWKALEAGKKTLIVLFHDVDTYIPYKSIRANLENYIQVIKATVEGKSHILRDLFGVDLRILKGIKRTDLFPIFVDDRERVVEIVRWKYWSGQDGEVGDPPEVQELVI